MLLLWLLLLPTVHATIECHSACGLCAMDPHPATAACTFCWQCKVHDRIMGPKTKILSKQQNDELKDMERREFRQVMKEYGWVPEDLIDSDSKVEKLTDENLAEEADECLPPPSNCINEEPTQKLAHTLKTECPTLPTTTKTCPPIKPCKNNNNRILKERLIRHTIRSTVPVMLLRQIVTLKYEADDHGCPTQPTCPDPENYEETVTPPTTSPVEVLEKKLKTTRPPTSCVPCMPLCPLPCGLAAQSSPILPSIPPEALAALMTLKPTTLDDKNTFSTQPVQQNIQNLVHNEISKVVEDTTKDYIYLYVGIPKSDKHGRYG